MSRIVLSIYDDVGNPHYGGGGAVVAHEVAQRLVRDHTVTVLTSSYRGSRGHRDGHVRYIYLPVGWAGPRAGQLLFHALLPLLAFTWRYDLWLESFTPPHSTSFLPLFARGRPVIGWAQMLSGEDMSRRYRLPFWWLERRGLAYYKRVIVLNDVDRQLVLARSPQAHVAVIPNGVQLPTLDGAKAGEGEFILYLGRIDVGQKGLDLLLDAYTLASPELPLLIAGTGTRTQEHALRLALPTGDRVQLFGRASAEQKAELLARCAFVVLPSRFETFGLAALEGMAYGKPVVVFDLPRLSWIAADSAVRVPPFKVTELAGALQRLSAEPERRAALGTRARVAAQDLDWDRIGQLYWSFVAEALLGRRTAGDT